MHVARPGAAQDRARRKAHSCGNDLRTNPDRGAMIGPIHWMARHERTETQSVPIGTVARGIVQQIVRFVLALVASK